mgnify:CR=1 FL=1
MLIRRIMLPLALALSIWQPVLAQHKWVSPEGRTTYSEHPCAAGSKAAAVRGGAASGA